MEDTDLPRPNGDAASRLASEDLAPYSQESLATLIWRKSFMQKVNSKLPL